MATWQVQPSEVCWQIVPDLTSSHRSLWQALNKQRTGVSRAQYANTLSAAAPPCWEACEILCSCLVTVFKAVHGIYCYQHSIRTTACMATNMHTAVISFYHLDTLSNLQAEVFNEVWPHNNLYLSVQGHGLYVYGEQSLSISFTSLYHPSTTLFTNQGWSKISEIAFPPAQRSGQTDNINLWCYKCH